MDIIKMYHKDIRCEGMDWIHLAQDRSQWWALMDVLMNEYYCLLGCDPV
jgi:hypothetical protein